MREHIEYAYIGHEHPSVPSREKGQRDKGFEILPPNKKIVSIFACHCIPKSIMNG